ncbi:MAG: hypothetical protein ACREVI_12950 [Steroidobacteraceae bacterium]
MSKFIQGRWLGALFALMVLATFTAQAQKGVGGEERNIEVISVDGNVVVVREDKGTQEYTVPSTFFVTVDGKEVALADLKPGMKGDAIVTEFTSVRPVHVATVNMGTVVSQTGRSVTVKEADGKIHRFTQGEADERGVRLYMDDGKAVRISGLNPGDELTATVVSAGPPEILTAADVDAALAAGDEPVAATAADADAATEASAAADAAPELATEPEEITSKLWIWILLLVVLALLLVWVFSRKKPAKVVTK